MLLFYTADKMESGKNMVSQGKVRENENLKTMTTLRGSQIEIQEDMISFLSICRYEIKNTLFLSKSIFIKLYVD